MRRSDELSRAEVDKMFFGLSLAVADASTPVEASSLLSDILTFSEAEMIAKRLKIAERLLAGDTYAQIKDLLKVSDGTIARVVEWLERSGEGYRRAVQAAGTVDVEAEMAKAPHANLTEIQRRFPMHYWPQILLQQVVAHSTKKQQREIRSVLRNMGKAKVKSSLAQRIEKILSGDSR